MKIIENSCPNCGNPLKIEKDQEQVTCEFCRKTYSIDDGTIKIEHKIEYSNEQDFKNAESYLENVKDYRKSEYLYRRLSAQYADKKEAWIGLVRSVTNDFTRTNYTEYEEKDILKYFETYKSLSSKKEYSIYEDKINEIHSYVLKNQALKRSKKLKKSIIFSTVVIIILSLFCTYELSPIKQSKNEFKLSEITNYCDELINCDITDLFKNGVNHPFKSIFNSLESSEVHFDFDKKEYEVSYSVKKIFKKDNVKYTFKVVDDLGPVVLTGSYKYYIGDDKDFSKKISVIDYNDGRISVDNSMIDYSQVDFNKVGKYNITVNVSDKDGNKTSKVIEVEVLKTMIKELNVDVKDSLQIGDSTKATYTIKPDIIDDKTVTWRTSDSKVLTVDQNGNVRAEGLGTAKVCAKADYDNQTESCKDIKVTLKCQDTYVFKFDGSKEEKITVGTNFCSGTYKFYAPTVLNNKEVYHIYIYQKAENHLHDESFMIRKNDSYFNDEGSKISVTDGQVIKIDRGITEFKLVKVK